MEKQLDLSETESDMQLNTPQTRAQCKHQIKISTLHLAEMLLIKIWMETMPIRATHLRWVENTLSFSFRNNGWDADPMCNDIGPMQLGFKSLQ